MKETYVSGSNYFNEERLKEMIQLLDKGEQIKIGIECIGHTRNNMEQENYKEALKKHYGNRLEVKVTLHNGACLYHYSYKLK